MLLSYVALIVTVLTLLLVDVVPSEDVAFVSTSVTIKFHLYISLVVLEQCPAPVEHDVISLDDAILSDWSFAYTLK